jgi:hypothetical protein
LQEEKVFGVLMTECFLIQYQKGNSGVRMKNCKYIFIVGIAVVMLLVSGCVGGDINGGALNYMWDKYGEKFQYVKAWGSSYMTPGIRKIMVSCESMPNEEILVVINEQDKTYSDNYIDHRFKSQVEEFIESIAESSLGEVEVDVSIPAIETVDGVSIDTNFEVYINTTHIVNGKITVTSTEAENVVEFTNKLREMKINYSLSIESLSEGKRYLTQWFDGDTEVSLSEVNI